MIRNYWHVAVLIPARNEEALLPRCLDSVLAACDALPDPATSDIVVAVDSCMDRSEEIAESMLRKRGLAIPTRLGIVGFARSLAAGAALRRYSGSLRQCWLANTDADCVVPEDWLMKQLEIADAGYEAVAGIVDVDSFAEHEPGVDRLFRESYLIHPDGTHSHVHGANLGVRADAYLRAGGWSRLETAEDHDLWDRLVNSGSRRCSTGHLSVLTSGRRVGRAPRGFAAELAAQNSELAA